MMDFLPQPVNNEPSSRLTGVAGEANFWHEGDTVRIQFVERLRSGETVNRMTLVLSPDSALTFSRLLARETVLADPALKPPKAEG